MSANKNRREQANKRFVRSPGRWAPMSGGGPHENANLQRNRRAKQKDRAIKESLESWSD